MITWQVTHAPQFVLALGGSDLVEFLAEELSVFLELSLRALQLNEKQDELLVLHGMKIQFMLATIFS